jgi:hypothetical protein
LVDLIPTPLGVGKYFRLATDAPVMFHGFLLLLGYQQEDEIDQNSPA